MINYNPIIAYKYEETLVELKDVCLSYDGVPILKGVNGVVRDIVREGCTQGQVVGILGPSGTGKCLAKGTPILMFDGQIKPVEKVAEGDLLMGPDSKPRRVLGLGRGLDEMYEILPIKGAAFTTNSEHILALSVRKGKRSKERNDEISVKEYLKTSRTYKVRAKLYRVAIDFPEHPVPLDPYFFGLWLGDGDCDNPAITSKDSEVVEYVQEFAQAAGAETTTYAYGEKCPRIRAHNGKGNKGGEQTILFRLRATGAVDNKHVPLVYKANSREVRLSVLAGLLDSDGSRTNSCFDYSTKDERLAEDICFLARSLGLAAYMKPCLKSCQTGVAGYYYRVSISGDTHLIPTKLPRKQAATRKQIKNVLVTGFSVEPKGMGQYFGFQLDGDGLFLLGDFTVSHNTQLSRILTGLQLPTSGTVEVEGKTGINPGLVGMVAQNYPLLRHRTVLGNLLAAQRGRPDAMERATSFLKDFGLEERSTYYPSQLSGGQRQRVAIIQQLLCSDHYLVMDEPFTGLDPIMKDKTCDLIMKVALMHEKNTIFIVAHDIPALVTVSDTLWLLGRDHDKDGKPIPGSRIQQVYDLAAMGLAWHPELADTPAYHSLVKEVKERFKTL